MSVTGSSRRSSADLKLSEPILHHPSLKEPRVDTERGKVVDTEREPIVHDAAPFREEMRRAAAAGDDDYTRKYVDDDYGAEMGPDARVWRTYIDEKDVADKEYISDNNATLDGILVFASIFSAIVTTFVTQTYQSLQPDTQAGLLAELIAVQRVAANGSSVKDVPSFATSPPIFRPMPADIWLNSLWFISLILSLLTAFIGVLAKQWLYQYVAVTSGAPRDRALVRQARSLGLHDWQVPALIGFLPVILHVSLALFLTGLIILLFSLLPKAAYFGIAAVGTVYTAYIVSNILPIIYPRCPYRTALTPKIYQLYQSFPTFSRLRIVLPVREDAVSSAWNLWKCCAQLQSVTFSAIPSDAISKDTQWKDVERRDALNTNGALEAKALSWLFTSSYNPTAKQVVLEAFAGLNPDHDQYSDNWDVDMIPQVFSNLRRECTRLCSTASSSGDDDNGRRLELYLRAMIQIQPFCPKIYKMDIWYHLRLPDGVEEYWSTHKCNSRLKTLLRCGLYSVNGVKHDKSFLHDVCAASGETEFSAGMWVALYRRQAGYEDLRSFNLTIKILTVLHEVNFFTSSPSPDDGSPRTMDEPTYAMCMAMFQCVVNYAGVDGEYTVDGLADGARPREVIRVLLHLILEIVERERQYLQHWQGPAPSENEVLEGISLMLDIIMSILLKSDHTLSNNTLWSSSETELLLKLTETKLFRPPADESAFFLVLRRVYTSTLALVERFCMTSNNIAFIPSNHLLNIALRTYLAHEPQGLSPRNPLPGQDILCWAFDQRLETIYEDIRNVDMFSILYLAVVADTLASYCFQFSIPILLDRLFAGLPTEYERVKDHLSVLSYVDRLIEYIHQPDNLFYLCYLLVRIDNSQAPLLRLLALKPNHHAWLLCLVNLKRVWVSEAEIGYKDRPVQENILAMQKILNIHPHNSVLDSESLDVLGLDFGLTLSSDNELLVAYRLSMQPDPQEREQKDMTWRERLRIIVSCARQNHNIPDLESDTR